MIFEKGIRADQGKIPFVNLFGTWAEMGRQYGALLRPELQDILAFVTRIENLSEENRKEAEKIRLSLFGRMSFPVRSFLAGASETCGISMEGMLSAFAVEYIAGLPQCSALAAWGDYAGGPLVFGRNYDYGAAFRELGKDVAVTVLHPGDGSPATAIAGYAGEIYAVNGMNEKGIFLELNNGTPTTGMPMDPARLTGPSCLLDALLRADSLSWLDAFFETVLCDDSYIINAADEKSARSWEWSQSGTRHAEQLMPDGLLVSTNYFLNPEWPWPTPDDRHSWDALTRRKNLLALAEQNKGRLNAERMTRLLETDISEGGATDELTVYQLVAVPEERTLRIRVPGYCGWEKLRLFDRQ